MKDICSVREGSFSKGPGGPLPEPCGREIGTEKMGLMSVMVQGWRPSAGVGRQLNALRRLVTIRMERHRCRDGSLLRNNSTSTVFFYELRLTRVSTHLETTASQVLLVRPPHPAPRKKMNYPPRTAIKAPPNYFKRMRLPYTISGCDMDCTG
jgi:hypothetical protein